MRIFILNPLIVSADKSLISRRKRQPLSLAYIASLLKEKHEIKFFDANALDSGLDLVLTEIKNFSPQVLILTSASVDRWECPHPKIDSVFEIINQAEIDNTVLIGPHGSLTPDWVFQKCLVKFIIRGEPELVAKNLIDSLAEGGSPEEIKGISYRSKNKIFHNLDAERINNLDELPIPSYGMLPMEKYSYSFRDLPQPFSIILSSRGCPFNCIYCLKVMSKGKYITRSPESVFNEIRYLKENFFVRSIFFQDWEFMIDKDRVRRICRLISDNNLKIIWGCNGRANNIDDELIKIMKQAGCVRINIGFESGSQKILDKAQKNIKVAELEKAIKICKGSGINVGMYALLNLPGEDKESLKETAKFLARNKIESMNFNLPVPYFGTPLFSLLPKKSAEIYWDNLEKYAGRISVKLNPFWARVLFRHYNYQEKLGRFYFLKYSFYKKIIKRFNKIFR